PPRGTHHTRRDDPPTQTPRHPPPPPRTPPRRAPTRPPPPHPPPSAPAPAQAPPPPPTGGGGAARQAHANPPLNRTPTSETVDGFTLSPTKGPANTAGTHTTITPPASGITFTQISAGARHSLAIGSDGNTYAWGDNWYGQLGDDTTDGRSIPVRVRTPAGVRFTQVSAGGNNVEDHSGFSLAIGDDGHAYSWGYNSYGELGNGSSDNNPHPTPARVTDPAPNTTWTTISAGTYHSLAIDSNGHAYSWGDNQWGQLGNGTTSAWGITQNTPVRVHTPAGVRFTQVSAGHYYSLAIGDDGHAYSWGLNGDGQLGDNSRADKNTPGRVTDPDPYTNWTAVSAGWQHSLAIDNHGYAYSWGRNDVGQLGNGSSDTNPHPTPTRVTDPAANTTWTSIDAGYQHSLAIDNHGHAYSWGLNGYGQLGNGSTDSNVRPTLAPVKDPAGHPNTTWTTISAGSDHSLAIDNHGHTYSWGSNRWLQLGDGSIDLRPHPTPVRVASPRYTITGVDVDGTTIGAADRSVNPRTGVWDITLPSHAPGRVDVTVTYRYEGLDANNNVIAGSVTTTGSVTLHYTYATPYTVRFSLGDAAGHTSSPTPADQHPLDGETISWPQDPEWEHHWLTGWAKADGSSWDFNTPVTSNMTLTAQWQAWQFTLN
ncbi:RCC1 domain-containing protein, partial [Bifidobacterium xylocopae]